MAIALWLTAAAPALASNDGVRVAVDLSALPAEVASRLDALILEQRVVQRLLQEGFTVVGPHRDPDVLLGAEPASDGLLLIARSAEGEHSARLVLGAGSRGELQLEVAQRLVDLGRAQVSAVERSRRVDDAPLPPPPERPRVTPFRPVPIEVPGPPPVPEVELAIAAAAEALWRGEVDPQIRLQLELRTVSPFALLVAGAFSSSTAPGLAVDEWQVQAGATLRFLQAGRLSARAGVLAGVASHRFRFAGEQAVEPTGQRLDLLVSTPVELLIRAVGPLELGLRLSPGLASRGREHARDGRVVWRREAARLEAGAWAGLAF